MREKLLPDNIKCPSCDGNIYDIIRIQKLDLKTKEWIEVFDYAYNCTICEDQFHLDDLLRGQYGPY